MRADLIRILTTYLLISLSLVALTGISSGRNGVSASVRGLSERMTTLPDTLSGPKRQLINKEQQGRLPVVQQPPQRTAISGAYDLRPDKMEEPSALPDTVAGTPADTPVGALQPPAADSLHVADPDSVKQPGTAVIDAPITYTATDSIIFDLESQKVYLYKSGVVTYQDITLTADFIRLDMLTKEIYAEGVTDTAGVVTGSPVFKQGTDEYESRTMRYNFKTEKGIIEDIKTQQGEGYIIGKRTKKIDKNVFIMKDGKYTTCEADHPHFYLNMTKAKVISNKTTITGPAYMVLEDFPIYFPFLPFGFFPNSPSYSSGIIIPSYGEENNRGFFLREGGYYWAASPFFDLKLTADIFSQGSWAVYVNSNYKKRYKYSGSLSFAYNVNKYGEKDIPEDYYETKGFNLRWSHSQDGKANPNQTFSASVNLSSSSYHKENSTNYDNYLSTTQSSSISYSRNFENSPFSMSANMTHSQNSSDSTISLSIPVLTFNMTKMYPFRRKQRVGSLKWYENIGFNYTGNIRNSIGPVKQSELLNQSLTKDWQNGWQHSLPISLPSMTLFKYINVSPTVSYQERWYTNKANQSYYFNDVTRVGEIVKDTVWGFFRNYNYSFSMSASTTIYGMFQPSRSNSRLVAVRHKVTPSLSFSYTPDFGQERFGFWGTYTDWTGRVVYYNRFEGAIFGSASRGQSQSMSFSLGNNIEAKILNKVKAGSPTDTVSSKTEEKFRKVKILDNLSFSGSYNFVADSMKLSNISISGRTTVAGTSFSFGATLDPYMVDSITGTRYNEFTWNHNKGLAKLGRVTAANLSFSLSFRPKDSKGGAGGGGADMGAGSQADTTSPSATGTTPPAESPTPVGPVFPEYVEFNMPWSLSTSFSLSYSRPNPYAKAVITSSLNCQGSLQLTDKWSMNGNTNFDLVAGKFSFTTFSVSRNLHCFNMSFNFVPFGDRKSYSFTLNASSSILRDLKIDRQRSWFDN